MNHSVHTLGERSKLKIPPKAGVRGKFAQSPSSPPLVCPYGHTSGGSTSFILNEVEGLTTLSSTPHFVLRLSVEGRSLRLKESLPKGGISNLSLSQREREPLSVPSA